jgi:hypothetical protein
MDMSLIPDGFNYASPTQHKFLKTASIKDVCERHKTYFTHVNSKNADNAIIIKYFNSLSILLSHLENLGLVESCIDQTTSRKLYNHIPMKHIAESVFKDSTPTLIPEEDREHLKSRTPFGNQELLSKLHVVSKYKSVLERAIRKGIDFNLDLEDVEKLLNTPNCYYTNQLFDDKVQALTQTFDRVDSTIGYVKGNVVACTFQVNELKNKLVEITGSTFPDIKTLKRFVDLIYIGSTQSKNIFNDLLIEEQSYKGE